jgi:hypothetical protein
VPIEGFFVSILVEIIAAFSMIARWRLASKKN